MWPKNFSERLESWAQLRQQCRQLESEPALIKINTWWFQSPWTAYHLHWDDQQDWPDPWQLLSDNQYCPVARGLGIMYTIAMLDRADLQDACMIEYQSDNLVLVNKEKYILNWDPDQVVKYQPGAVKTSAACQSRTSKTKNSLG
jgi:hypothetical protein